MGAGGHQGLGVYQLLSQTLSSLTPITLAALGCVFAHRAGVFHLGLEGLMIVGAFLAVAFTVETGSVMVGIAGAVGIDIALSVLFWIVIIPLRANTIIAGLGLSGLGVGASAYALRVWFDTSGAIQADHGIWRPVGGDHEGPLEIISGLSIMVWLVPVVVVLSWFVLRRTRFGLRLAATGEYPFAARSAGVRTDRMRLVALMITGALCALAGAELALGSVSGFSENMTNGRGFIAFSAAIFGLGSPIATACASAFFGFAESLGIQAQVTSVSAIPVQFILALPYLVTIVAVTITGIVRREDIEVTAAFNELRE